MNWKRVLTGFLFACLGSVGLMASLPLLLGLCDPSSAFCPKEPNILVYFGVVASLIVLLFGMGTLLRSGHASYRETHPVKERPVTPKPEAARKAGGSGERPSDTGQDVAQQFDREAVMAEMTAKPVFGQAKRRPLVSPSLVSPSPVPAQPVERDDAIRQLPLEALLEPQLPIAQKPEQIEIPQAPIAPSNDFYGGYASSSPMAPRIMPRKADTH